MRPRSKLRRPLLQLRLRTASNSSTPATIFLPTSLQIINLAGEPLERRLLDDIYAQKPEVRVFNLYGPSEDTTYSTGAEMPPDREPHLGRPIPGTQAYLTDPRLCAVAVGTLLLRSLICPKPLSS